MIDATPRDAIAIGLLVADDGRLLLQHRDNTPGLPDAGRWGFFGGHVEPGETPVAAFLREMQEELSWRPRHFEPYEETAIARGGGRQTISHAYAAHLDVPLEALTLGEGQGLALFAPDSLPDDMVEGARDFLELFSRSEAYARMQRSYASMFTTALLVNDVGEFLLQHRDDKPEIRNPGRWGSFGGELEPYETPHDGLLRELREELSWQPERIELVQATPYESGGAWRLAYVFAAHIGVPLDALVLGEGQGMGFFAPRALPENMVRALGSLVTSFAKTEAYARLSSGPREHRP